MMAIEKENLYSSETTATRRLPVNFEKKDAALFEHELEKKIPTVKILKYENVKISSDGIIFYKNRILTESFAFPANFDRWKKRAVVKTYLNNLVFKRPREINDAALWATDDWSAGYFHWLCDVLPRLIVAAENFNRAVLLLPSKFADLDYVAESLHLFGIENVRFIGAREVVRCRTLYLPTHTAASGDFNEPIIKKVRHRLLEKSGANESANKNRRIYISRSLAGKRRVSNEAEIFDVLREYDFETVRAEDYSFGEQIELFAAARYLVAVHGAGMTNMLFMPVGSRVLELRKFDDATNNCYFNMASALNLNFYYQLCQAENPQEDAHTADIVVDRTKLAENLAEMFRDENAEMLPK